MTESLNSNIVLNPKLNSKHNKWRTITGDIVGNSAVSVFSVKAEWFLKNYTLEKKMEDNNNT